MLLFPELWLLPITHRCDEVQLTRPIYPPLSLRHKTDQTTPARVDARVRIGTWANPCRGCHSHTFCKTYEPDHFKTTLSGVRGCRPYVSSSRNSGIWYQNKVRMVENCCIPITFRLTVVHTPAYASGVRAR